MHERIYTIRNENDLVEFTTWKVRAIGPTAMDLAPASEAAAGAVAPAGTRTVHLPGGEAPCAMPVYRGRDIGAGACISGPAIVEEATTTILLPHAAAATVDALGNYRVTLE